MQKLKFIKNYNKLQQLFRELNDANKLSDPQIDCFNAIQLEFFTIYNKEHNSQNNVELPWKNEDFKEAWGEWKKYKKQQFRFTYQPIGEKASLDDLVRLSKNNKNKAIELIKHAIAKSWQGIHKIKETQKIISKSINKETDFK